MKQLRYIIIIAVTIAALYVYLRSESRKTGGRKPLIVPENIASLDGITIAKDGDTFYYSRGADGLWTTDQGIQADAGFITESLSYLEIISPASKSISDGLADVIKAEGTSIKLYQGNKIRSDFRILHVESGIPGSYLLADKSLQPYLVRVRNYMTNNAEKFILGINDRVSDTFFKGVSSGTITGAGVYYPHDKGDSFSIFLNKEGYVLSIATGDTVAPEMINSQKITDYLSFFDDFKTLHPQKGKAENMTASLFATLEIATLSGREIRLEAFRNKHNEAGRDDGIDMSVFTGIINNTDTMLFYYSDMDPFFRKAAYFLKNQ